MGALFATMLVIVSFWVFVHVVCQSPGASGYQALERLFRHLEPILGLNLYVHVSTYPCKSYQLLLGSFTSFNSLFKCSGV